MTRRWRRDEFVISNLKSQIIKFFSARPLRSLRLCGERVSPRARLKLAIVALSLSIALSACSTQSSADELKEALRTQGSWAATIRMIAESRTQGAVPKAYTRKALENIEQELQKEGERLNKSKIPSEERMKVIERVQSLKQSADEIKRAVEQEDASATGVQIEKLKTEEQMIRQSLSESTGEPAR